jgi:hypothetical protein
MKTTRLLTLLALVTCLVGWNHLSAQTTLQHAPDSTTLQDLGNEEGPFGLSKHQLLSLGYRMWNNYAGGTLEGLTKWDGSDEHHQFMYLGIANNIWKPANADPMFGQDWPTVARRLQELGCKIQPWMLEDCPWKTEEEFDASFNGKKMTWLRNHLSKKKLVRAQAFCIAERLERTIDENSVDSLLTGLNDDQKAVVKKNFDLVVHTKNPFGCYALIDYVNFKGEGKLGISSQFNGESWGLLQVLLNMKTPEDGANDSTIINTFVDGAKVTLHNRIINHKIEDPNSNDAQYWDIWVAHLDNYLLTNEEVKKQGLDQAPTEDNSNK